MTGDLVIHNSPGICRVSNDCRWWKWCLGQHPVWSTIKEVKKDQNRVQILWPAAGHLGQILWPSVLTALLCQLHHSWVPKPKTIKVWGGVAQALSEVLSELCIVRHAHSHAKIHRLRDMRKWQSLSFYSMLWSEAQRNGNAFLCSEWECDNVCRKHPPKLSPPRVLMAWRLFPPRLLLLRLAKPACPVQRYSINSASLSVCNEPTSLFSCIQ